MPGKVEFGSDVLGLKSVNFEKINEKRLKPFEDKKEKIQDIIDLTTDTNEARGELKTRIDGLQKSLSNILSQTDAKFAHVVHSSEPAAVGASADDYFDVTASDSSHIGALDVRVQQLATNASASLCKLAGNAGFDPLNHADIFQNDALSIVFTNVEGNVNPVVIHSLYGQTINEVVTRINKQLKHSNVKEEAVLEPSDVVPGNVQRYKINIRSTITGGITIALRPKDYPINPHMQVAQQVIPNPLIPPVPLSDPPVAYYAPSNTQGQNAIVHVNGQAVTSHTNVIKLGKGVNGADVPHHIAQGITLTLKKENSTFVNAHGVVQHHHQTIHIEQDKNVIGDKIGEFVDAYNDLKEFVASQEKRNANGTGYETDAYLARTRELRIAKDLLHSMTDRIDVAGLLKVNSLRSMGILPGEKGAGLAINNDRLKDIADTDFDEIVKFFNNVDGFGAKFIGRTSELLKLIDEEAKPVPEKLLKAQAEYEKADKAAQKEQKKINEEMAQMDFINMQASMMQMYFQAMMSQG
jgi:flagellar capping protein FliD